MKKIFILLTVLSCLPVWAQPNCDVEAEAALSLMGAEMKRSMPILKKQKPPVYYLSYIYTEGEEAVLSVSYGGVASLRTAPVSVLEVIARAGSPRMDNTRALKGERESFAVGTWRAPVPLGGENKAFTKVLWRATQEAAEKARQDFSRVQTNVRTMSDTRDKSDDFVFPPVSTYCQTAPKPDTDLAALIPLLTRASALVRGAPYVLDSSFVFSVSYGHRYFADSQGTRLKTPYTLLRLMYQVSGRTADGLEISRTGDYGVSSQAGLPGEQKLFADVKASLSELKALSQAPQGDPLSAPAILKGRAAAVFVHEVLGHRLEGHRQKDESEGQTFTGKTGQRVISSLLSVVDDPTLTEFNGAPLRGHYVYDDEGVAARPVTLIENGVLKNFLMSSSPIEGFAASNGHGRRESGRRAVARMGVMKTTASKTVPYEELEKMLVAEINRQGKPYGFIIEDLGGGFTTTQTQMPQTFKLQARLVWRVYPDGRKEPVRGLDVVGTPLVSFNRVLAAADDYTLFDGSCGAESGWVAQSNIAPSLLFEALETERTQKSNFKPPVLPAPYGLKGGKK